MFIIREPASNDKLLVKIMLENIYQNSNAPLASDFR
jgi:hypothetical protein